ncbi:MAG TPA: response regulator [Myxococcales bacterium]|jgi:CheY-like chemotaxis protein
MAAAKKKILLVDDSSTVLLTERTMFDDGRFTILTARNGREAVEAAKREQPDMIFMDVVMPEMDGFEAVRTLRAHAPTKDTPIVMVTTRSEPKNVQAGYEAGCDEYMTKPFNHLELMEKLRHYLGE